MSKKAIFKIQESGVALFDSDTDELTLDDLRSIRALVCQEIENREKPRVYVKVGG